MLISVSACFYTLFLFDTLGDAVGFQGAYWVLIVMPLMPLCMYSVHTWYNRRTNSMNSSSSNAKLDDGCVSGPAVESVEEQTDVEMIVVLADGVSNNAIRHQTSTDRNSNEIVNIMHISDVN